MVNEVEEKFKQIMDGVMTVKICGDIINSITDSCIESVNEFIKKYPESERSRDGLLIAAAVKFTYQIVLDSLRDDSGDEEDCCDGECDECEEKCNEDEEDGTPSSAADVLRELLK